ncbi:MAG: UDP-N-acetylmuramoyl-L-alanine--D-glutamate ligase [Clostridiales bacterium]|nr:UDP-N-acetylmuramoyl-L-alanine--D-glutamate ligase [Clostridiales bacterium]
MTDFESFFSKLKEKRIAVIGLGVSNTPLIRILSEAGAKITVCDKKDESKFSTLIPELKNFGVQFQLGEHYLEGLDHDYIFRSPGIRPDRPELLKAIDQGSVLTSEMEVFIDVCPCPIIAVTGSDGKTTTSTLISKIIEAEGKRCFLGGNIGKPLLAMTKEIKSDDFVVLELSSFQLMTMKKSPNVAVVTNVAPNHLDWHTSMEEYTEAKKNIYLHQKKTDTVVLNADNDAAASFSIEAKGNVILFSRRQSLNNGICMENDTIVLRKEQKTIPIVTSKDILIPGEHNRENYMAASAACYAIFGEKCFEAVKQVAKSFKGVEHRIELVREKDGVRFYNDSIASSPTRTIAGLHSFQEKVFLIAGGYDKHIPFDVLGPEIVKHVKRLYLTGQTSKKIRESIEKCPEFKPELLPVSEYQNFSDAVKAAAADAKQGDIVILSPACASFDMFANFAERGHAFRDIVHSL